MANSVFVAANRVVSFAASNVSGGSPTVIFGVLLLIVVGAVVLRILGRS